MSKFASEHINGLEPYVPGERSEDGKYVRLNTNENPYPPSDTVTKFVNEKILNGLNRYSDPDAHEATEALAEILGVKGENVLLTNGSDEAIAFSFLAFGEKGIVTPDITYTLYRNIAALFKIPYREVPTDEHYRIRKSDFYDAGRTVVIANPNAQTAVACPDADIEDIVKNNPDSVVIIDQAYAAFSPCDAVPLTKTYKNLAVIETFSKCRSLAGARLGYMVADAELIKDVKKVKFSFNPYNVNALSQALALGSAKDDGSVMENVGEVTRLRESLTLALRLSGFDVLPSCANFLCAEHPEIDGKTLCDELKKRGVLVRHFSGIRTENFVRITVGTKEENDALIKAVVEILEERK